MRRSCCRFWLLISVGLAGCTAAENQTAEPATLSTAERAEIEAMLLDWENQWVDAYQTGDLSVLERILAPDFIYTIPSGEVHDKASFIALEAGDPITYSSYETGDMTVRWYADNVVVITGLARWSGTDEAGNEVSGGGAWTNVFVERDGEWQVVVGHASGPGE